MKHSKLLALMTVFLALLMLFTACGKSGETPIQKILLKDASYPDSAPSYTSISKCADLTGTVEQARAGDLILLTKSNVAEAELKYFVYNLATGTVVWSDTQTLTYSIEVNLGKIFVYEDKWCSYFEVKTTTTNPENESTAPTVTTAIYDAKGEKVASANRNITVENKCDLLYFDGKMYRATEDGKITYVFDYSIFANIPDISTKYRDQYYVIDENHAFIAVYDLSLNFISRYNLPAHFEESYNDLMAVILENGNVLVQYIYDADEYSDDYTVIYDIDDDGSTTLRKYVLVTELVNIKNGTAKKIECDFAIQSAVNLLQAGETAKKIGINPEKNSVYAQVSMIENRRFSDVRTVFINNNGKCTALETINGEQIYSFALFTQNCWRVRTESSLYLVNEKGEIIGDVSKAGSFGNFFYRDGKIFDSTLSMIYDFQEKNLTIKKVVGRSLLLEGADGQLLLYMGSGDPITLIGKNSDKAYICANSVWNNSGYIVIENGDQYEIYNDKGTKVGTLDDDIISSASTVIATDNATLILFHNSSNEAVYYRLS